MASSNDNQSNVQKENLIQIVKSWVTIDNQIKALNKKAKALREEKKSFNAQMIEVMSPDYFDLKYLRYLTDKYFSYYHKYKDFPTLSLLITIIRDDLRVGNDIILRDQIVEFLHRIKSSPDLGDLQFVKDKSLDFCKKYSQNYYSYDLA